MMRYLPLLLLFFTGCTDIESDDVSRPMGFAPIYAKINLNDSIGVKPLKATSLAGKIYAYGTYAFQVDQYTGIHIIENARSSSAKKIAFLQIPMCTEIAIKDNHLYTNNINDMVVFSLDDPQNPKLVNRLKNAFPQISQEYPPVSNVYFECPDPSKGIVVGWEQKILTNPACRR